jgi:hypothetical protein
MKKLIFIALVFIIGCKAPQFYLGMNELDFKKRNHSAQIVEASQQRTVYKQINYPFGAPAKVKFFYFQGGKLIGMDEGTRQPDLIIDKTIHNQ